MHIEKFYIYHYTETSVYRNNDAEQNSFILHHLTIEDTLEKPKTMESLPSNKKETAVNNH